MYIISIKLTDTQPYYLLHYCPDMVVKSPDMLGSGNYELKCDLIVKEGLLPCLPSGHVHVQTYLDRCDTFHGAISSARAQGVYSSLRFVIHSALRNTTESCQVPIFLTSCQICITFLNTFQFHMQEVLLTMTYACQKIRVRPQMSMPVMSYLCHINCDWDDITNEAFSSVATKAIFSMISRPQGTSPGMNFKPCVNIPGSKVHGANMGPTWGRQDSGGPMLAPWTLLSGIPLINELDQNSAAFARLLLHNSWHLRLNSNSNYSLSNIFCQLLRSNVY